MKKIVDIIDSCSECPYCAVFNRTQGDTTRQAVVCDEADSLIMLTRPEQERGPIAIPDWCPLETYKEPEPAESAAPGSAQPEERGTIILPGLPHLEWMTENLSGFGGTEVNGRWYYTYEQAEEAVKQLGNGWRLATIEEWQALDKLGSEWQEDGPHGLPGRLFGGVLFLEAAGNISFLDGDALHVGFHGYYWIEAEAIPAEKYPYLYITEYLTSDYLAKGIAPRSVRLVRKINE